MQQSIELIARAARATVALQPLTDSDINALLVDVADALRRDSDSIIEANRLDLERMCSLAHQVIITCCYILGNRHFNLFAVEEILKVVYNCSTLFTANLAREAT